MSKLPGRTDGFQKAAQLNKKLNQRDYKYARVREMVDDIIVSENDQDITINFNPQNY